MKKLLVTLEYPPYHGGIAHYYSHLVQFSPEPIAVLTNAQGHLINQHWPAFKWLPSLYWIARAIKEHRADQILVGQILPIGTAVFLLSRFLPIRYTVFLHGLDLSQSQATPIKKFLAKLILNHAHRIICANSRTAAEARGLVEPDQITAIKVVNPGIDHKAFIYDETLIAKLKTKYQLQSKKVLLTVARLVHRKGIDLVLHALAACADPSLCYVIIGEGPEAAKLRQLITELNLESQVILLSAVDDETRDHFFQIADIFIMTSRDQGGDYEGFGIVYLEAALAGKPVIASSGGGVTDAVIDNQTGLLVKPEPEAIKVAITKLISYDGLARRLADNGRRRAQQNFAWPDQARKIIDIIS